MKSSLSHQNLILDSFIISSNIFMETVFWLAAQGQTCPLLLIHFHFTIFQNDFTKIPESRGRGRTEALPEGLVPSRRPLVQPWCSTMQGRKIISTRTKILWILKFRNLFLFDWSIFKCAHLKSQCKPNQTDFRKKNLKILEKI